MSKTISLHLNPVFAEKTGHLKSYLTEIKDRFDNYDVKHQSTLDRAGNLNSQKESIFNTLDILFKNIWSFVEAVQDFEYEFHKKYFYEQLNKLIFVSEINRYIYEKPLGYPGDFIMMLYLYDYESDYLGDSSFAKLLNNYTCNIPISKSVVSRKNYFKECILETVKNNKDSKILNIACGSSREITELIEEDRIANKVSISCLDFERKAFDYIRKSLNKIKDNGSKSNVKIDLINSNFTDLILKKEFRHRFIGQDLIYSAGLFDYLSDRVATKLLTVMFKLLNPGGKIIVSNVSLCKSSHRAYYEMVGDWVLKYRDEENLIKWTDKIKGEKVVSFEKPKSNCVFDLLCIKKHK